jgi:rfaE bifunctional protein kinase chain/domain
MNYERLAHLLSEMQSVGLAIVGDFFLDYYMVIDPQLEEVSLETGLPAHQVVELRPSPGAAGSVTTKVAALGVQAIYAVTMLGEDGNGYDLTRELKKTGLRFEHVVRRGDRFTPTYGKPMLRRPDGKEEEINRIDVKNRQPLPKEAEDAIVGSLRQLVSGLDGIIVIDQVEQPNCGVVTDRVREEVCRLGSEYPDLVILADSRTRIGRFRNVMTKPNFTEASQALGLPVRGESEGAAREMAQRLASVMGRPVFLTIGPRGLVAADGREAHVVPAFPVEGALDTTGAGDTVTAGIVTALCAGASIAEAAEVGNLAASITIKQLGITGTATPRQMLQALEAHRRRDQAMRDR